jgi:hypothetical protein
VRLFFVLAFTAYCFPIVVLAWRNAAFQASLSDEDRLALARPIASEAPDDLQVRAWASEIDLVVLRFRKQLTVVAIGWPIFIGTAVALALVPAFVSVSSLEISGPIAFALMAFTLWTLFAGMFKQQVLIRRARELARASRISHEAHGWVLGLSIATGVFTLALPTLFFAGATINTLHLGQYGWLAALICSFATLISQTASFIIASNAAKRVIAEELAKVGASASL